MKISVMRSGRVPRIRKLTTREGLGDLLKKKLALPLKKADKNLRTL